MSLENPNIPPNVADPNAHFVNASCIDLLLIEMVPLAYRIAHESSQPTLAVDGDVDDEEHKDVVQGRLDFLGYRVGQGLVERFSRDRPRFVDALDVIKFLCKDLWMLVFRKQIDNLKTNHRGVYVLIDHAFKPFTRMSMVSTSEAVMKAQSHLWFPCGIIRGSLASMGINATVHAETSELPAATFQIRTIANNP